MSGFLNAQTRVREGSNPYGTSLYNWDGKYLKEGHSSCNKTLINWDGKNIRNGESSYATVLYTWDGANFRDGSSAYGTILYKWDGKNILKGSTGSSFCTYEGKVLRASGMSVCNADGEIPVPVLIYIVHSSKLIRK